MVKELGKQAGSNFERFPASALGLEAAANEYQATVYQKHRSMQKRKLRYMGWNLPSAGRLIERVILLDEPLIEAPVNGSSNYKHIVVVKSGYMLENPSIFQY